MWLSTSHNSYKSQFPSSVPFASPAPLVLSCLRPQTAPALMHFTSDRGFMRRLWQTGWERQPLPSAVQHDSRRIITFWKQAELGGCLCTRQSSPSPGVRLCPAQPFSHGLQKPVLGWFGNSRGQDSSWIAYCLPMWPSNTFLPGLNWSDLVSLTLVEKRSLSFLSWGNSIYLIWPHLLRGLPYRTKGQGWDWNGLLHLLDKYWVSSVSGMWLVLWVPRWEKLQKQVTVEHRKQNRS